MRVHTEPNRGPSVHGEVPNSPTIPVLNSVDNFLVLSFCLLAFGFIFYNT